MTTGGCSRRVHMLLAKSVVYMKFYCKVTWSSSLLFRYPNFIIWGWPSIVSSKIPFYLSHKTHSLQPYLAMSFTQSIHRFLGRLLSLYPSTS